MPDRIFRHGAIGLRRFFDERPGSTRHARLLRLLEQGEAA
jgi:hypothetical protein